MEQLTKEQAIAFAESKAYESFTDEQIVKFQLFQKKLCMPFDRFHEAMEKVLQRPVFTHEFAYEGVLEAEFLGTKPPPTFEEIVNLIPKEKRVIIGI